MENFIKKVIKASAGTGKTYRLSLEYIGVLLKFADLQVSFSEILVITFTKKATAEIRERIFSHLKEITQQTTAGKQLCENIKQILNIEVSANEIEILKRHYERMLVNKNKVSISTIDSFTNNVFKTVIAPYLGIMNYDVKSSNDDDLLSEIYETLLEQDNLEKLKDFFFRSDRRNIGNYKNMIQSILDKRWLIHLITDEKMFRQYEQVAANYVETKLANFRSGFFEVLEEFQNYLNDEKKDKLAKNVIRSEPYKKFFEEDVPAALVSREMMEKLAGEKFLLENAKVLFDVNPFWNGGAVFRKKNDKAKVEALKEKLTQALTNLADYLFFTCLLPEEEEIKYIAHSILQKYDVIKFRDKVFTYNDISYYTFKYLYQPELSLIDFDNVTNAFYEYLSTSIRFLLIDEFQDTSIIQFKILMPIIREIISGVGVKEYGGVIAVGDEKQSIYGWRDGERELLLNLPKILDAEVSSLDTSYRSDENIINFINHVFSGGALREFLERKEIDWQYGNVAAHKKNNSGYVEVTFRNFSAGTEKENDIQQEEEAIREFIENGLYPLISEGKISTAGTAILARHNRDLRQIASILDELGVPYISESSTSILQHRAIKPVIYFYRFLVYKDIIDLLRFFRSDFVLMNTEKLRQLLLVYRQSDWDNKNPSAILKQCSFLPEVVKLQNFVRKIEESAGAENNGLPNYGDDLFNLTKHVFEEHNVTSIFNLENDVKNINLFLEMVADFENARQENPRSLKDFLDYCEEIEREDEFQQLGMETADALRLMSIHKAKGLEFANVFLYWNISGGSKSAHGQVNYYPNYAADFSALDNYVLTYNFDYVLENCSNKFLFANQRKREEVEILNTFYVAATRPKSNLFINFTYQKSEGFTKFISDIEQGDDPTILKAIFYSIYCTFSNTDFFEKLNEYKAVVRFGGLVSQPELSTETTVEDFSFVKKYLNPERSQFLKKDETRLRRDAKRHFKKEYLEQRSIEQGNVAHYYLSFVKFDTEKERRLAQAKTITKYGSLFKLPALEKIFQKVNQFIEKNPLYFSREKWDRILTEHTIYSAVGKELRLDRLMISEREKFIQIIDYKTGEEYDEAQIVEYASAVRELSLVKENGFDVEARFVEVTL